MNDSYINLHNANNAQCICALDFRDMSDDTVCITCPPMPCQVHCIYCEWHWKTIYTVACTFSMVLPCTHSVGTVYNVSTLLLNCLCMLSTTWLQRTLYEVVLRITVYTTHRALHSSVPHFRPKVFNATVTMYNRNVIFEPVHSKIAYVKKWHFILHPASIRVKTMCKYFAVMGCTLRLHETCTTPSSWKVHYAIALQHMRCAIKYTSKKLIKNYLPKWKNRRK